MEERGSPGAAAKEAATKKMGWGGRAELGRLRDEWEASLLEKGSLKGLIWVPDQLHKPEESFPDSFLIFHSPFLPPRALPTHSPFWPSALWAWPHTPSLPFFSAREGKRCWHLSRCAYI